MTKISVPIASIAFVAALLLLALASPVIDRARADDCAAAPSAAAPPGQHWYYHNDRVKRRKCWYLHATLRLQRRISPRLESHAVSTASMAPGVAPQAASPPADLSAPASPADSMPRTPQIKILSVKTIAAPFVSTDRRDDAGQRAAQTADMSPQAEHPSTPAVDEAAVQVARTEPPDAGLTAASKEATQRAATVGGFARPEPAEMLFLLAVAMSLLAFLIAIVSKTSAMHRNPRVFDDADASWSGYSFGPRQRYHRIGFDEQAVSIVSPAEQHGLGEPPEQGRIDQSCAPGEVGPPSQRHIASAKPLERTDIERALRVLRQVREEHTALSS